MSKELDKQVTEIKRLVENDKAELAIQLVRALDDPKIYEDLLEDCSIDGEGRPELPDWMVDEHAERDQVPFFLELIAECPEQAKIDPSLTKENLTSLTIEGCSYLRYVEGLSGLTNLTSLTLYGCDSLTNVDGLSGLTNLPKLDLSNCSSLTNVEGLSGLTKLPKLDLSNCSP